MKKWSFVVAALYGLILVVVFVPLVAIGFLGSKEKELQAIGSMLSSGLFWLIISVLALAQFLLLRVPVALAHRRPVKQRSVWTTVLAAAFMMGLLVYGVGLSVCEALTQGEEAKGWSTGMWLSLAAALTSWGAWAIYFYWSTKISEPEVQMDRIKRFLWTGSILELLVAIPTHIVARHRDHCCAGYATFLGLTCGISVMLFAFGPAVYFLFVERWKRLHPKD